jgi:hypothetical protein
MGEQEVSAELIEALRELEREKGIAFDTILQSLEEALASALKLREQLAVEFPDDIYYKIQLGGSYANLARAIRISGRIEDSLPGHEEAVRTLQAAHAADHHEHRACHEGQSEKSLRHVLLPKEAAFLPRAGAQQCACRAGCNTPVLPPHGFPYRLASAHTCLPPPRSIHRIRARVRL